jgi:hypothetical protein
VRLSDDEDGVHRAGLQLGSDKNRLSNLMPALDSVSMRGNLVALTVYILGEREQ